MHFKYNLGGINKSKFSKANQIAWARRACATCICIIKFKNCMQLLKVDLISKDNLLVQHKYAKRKYPELRCVKNFLRTPPTFHKNIRFGIKITVSQCEVFPFYPAKIAKKSYKKVTSAGKKPTPTHTPEGHSLIFYDQFSKTSLRIV